MRSLRATLRERRTWATGAVIGVLVASAGLTAYGLFSADDPRAAEPGATATPSASLTSTAAASTTASATPVRWASILNGAPMSEEQWKARKDLLPIAIMIDNTAGALPHVGLDRADVVYEAFVEGGITRLMAVFWSQEADLVEPVRSARTPFVVWVDELGALYAHAGAADTNNDADATGQIFAWEIMDLNAFSPGPGTAFHRDPERYAPYNLATSTTRLREAAGRLGFSGPSRLEPWKFNADGEGSQAMPQVEAVQLDFQERGSGWQTIQWRWDAPSKRYLRFQFGAPFVDRLSGQQIGAANVVVMRLPWEVVDDAGHVLLEQFGAGEATVFLDGRAIAATWKKPDRRGRTRFYDAAGSEIAFSRGPIWIEAAGPASKLVTATRARDMPALPPYTPPPPAAAPEEPEDLPPAATPEPSPRGTPSPTGSATVPPTAGTTTPGATPATNTPVASPTASDTPVPSPTTAETPQPSPTAG